MHTHTQGLYLKSQNTLQSIHFTRWRAAQQFPQFQSGMKWGSAYLVQYFAVSTIILFTILEGARNDFFHIADMGHT